MSTRILDIGDNFLLLNSTDEFYQTTLAIFIALSILINLYILIPPFFIYYYRRVNHIQTRNYTLLFLQCFMCIPLCNLWLARIRPFGSIAYRSSLFRSLYGCEATFFVTYLFFPLALLTLFMRLGHFVLSEAMSQSIMQRLDGKSLHRKHNIFDRFMFISLRYILIRNVYNRHRPTDSGTTSVQSLPPEGISQNDTMAKVSTIAVLRNFAVTIIIEVALMAVAILPHRNNVPYCDTRAIFTPLYILIVPSPLISILLLYLIRDMQDKFGIKSGLIITFCSMFINIILYFVAAFPTWYIGYTYINGVAFLLFGTLVVLTVDVVLPVYRAYRHIKHNSVRIKGGKDKLSLEQVMEDPALWAQFQQQVISDFAGENIQFINDYRKLVSKNKLDDDSTARKILDNVTPVEQPTASPIDSKKSPTDTMRIELLARNYIIPGAPFELNISGKVRSSVIEQVKACRANGGNITVTILDPVMKEVKKNLEMNSLPRFQAELNRKSAEMTFTV
ncbi:hypothetical protein BKA69DRAFT_527218 [Paraphysoderma sedebokerense]|nr:hypothetical protein BKA69DRAFT_527218 [Paraphysoderma sedebokerense]